jgi:hypothetical protein
MAALGGVTAAGSQPAFAADAGPCAAWMHFALSAGDSAQLPGVPGTLRAFVRDVTAGQRLTLQSTTGPSWVDVAGVDLATSTPGLWTPVDLSYPATLASGTPAFRFVMTPSSASCTGIESSAQVVTFRKAEYAFTAPYSRLSSAAAPTASGRSPFALVGYAVAEEFNGQPLTSAITVQRSVAGGAWEPLAAVPVTVTARADDPGRLLLEAAVPAPFTAANHPPADVAYRFASTESDAVTATASTPLTVSYFNAQAVVRETVRRYCSSTQVTFTNKFIPALSGAAGYYSNATKRIEVRPSVIDDQMSLEAVRFLAYHECAHVLQYASYSSPASVEKAARRIFGTNHSQPIEHWADCVAFLSQPVAELSYGSTCTAKQLQYAKKTLKKKRL